MPHTPLEQLLLELLHIPSESGHEEEILEMMIKKIPQKLTTQKIPVSDGRYNILSTIGTPKIIFAAHIDTVIGQLPIDSDEHNIYGRGSCDNKAAAAAMIFAAQQALAANTTDFGLLFTVGEETTFDGAQFGARFLLQHHIIPELIVIGEPTGLEVITCQKGVLCIELTSTGTMAHSSIQNPDSAVHKLIPALQNILELNFPDTLMNIAQISGGEAENIIAPRATAIVTWRSELVDIQERVEKLLAAQKDIHVIIKKNITPVVREWKNFPKKSVSFFTEMAFFKNSIVCGPGDIRHAHSENEFVPRYELSRVVEKYLSLFDAVQ